MRILGIDPGTNVLGFAVLEIQDSSIVVLRLGVVRMKKYFSHQEKLHQIFVEIQKIIDQDRPSEMAIEAPFFGKNVQSMLKLGRAQGVAIAAALQKNIKVEEYSPKKIKVAVTGNGNASKEQVAAMVNQLVKNKIDTSMFDATDALATAICHHYQSSRVKVGGAQYKDWSAFVKANPGRSS